MNNESSPINSLLLLVNVVLACGMVYHGAEWVKETVQDFKDARVFSKEKTGE